MSVHVYIYIAEQLIELWENCLQAYASVLVRCPREMEKYDPSLSLFASLRLFFVCLSLDDKDSGFITLRFN